MATGFHGFHVLIGTIFLIVCLVRAYAGHFTPHAASRLRVRRLVLALRRRGVAVPVRLHLCLGRAGTPLRALTRTEFRCEGAAASRPFCVMRTVDMTDEHVKPSPIHRPGSPAAARAAARASCSRAFSNLRPRCEACGLDYAFADAGDGPAVFVILIAGLHRGRLRAGGRVHLCSRRSGCMRVLWLPLILVVDAAAAAPAQGAADRAAVSPQGRRRPARDRDEP